VIAASICLVAGGWTSAQAAGWGSVKGKFVYDGAPPTAPKLVIDKDAAVCGVAGLVDESLVVGKDGGIANVVVGLFLRPGQAKPAVHPDYAKEAGKEVEFDNAKCRFEPHIAIVRTDQVLVLKNGDAVGHNVKADLLNNASFNDLIPAGASLKKTLKSEERIPLPASCNIHTWMKGYVVVRNDPYAAVSAADGSFEIKNLPEGTWTLRVWQEKSGFVQDVKLNGKATKWMRGQFDVKIEDGKVQDLGNILVGPAVFAK
jgi:hypothetical protein